MKLFNFFKNKEDNEELKKFKEYQKSFDSGEQRWGYDYEMIPTSYQIKIDNHYTLTVYEHKPRTEIGTYMRIILTESWDEEKDVKRDYDKDFLRINGDWYRIIQRYKTSERDYVMVVECMAYYSELEEYKYKNKED